MKNEALYYKKLDDEIINCQLCPHNCRLKDGQTGICGVREVEANKLVSLNYGKVSSMGIDPVEKKPLYHFYPGSSILSIGTWGCNFSCGFCQNWQISQQKPSLETCTAEKIVDVALKRDSLGIAYTYSEPLIWFEFVLEVAELAREKGLKNVLVSNGFINQKPLQELLPFIDAANIDLKSFSDDFYTKHCGGELNPVLESIKTIYQQDTHLEVTTLLIGGLNDDEQELEKLFNWIGELDPEIPLHLSRYFPSYKMTKKATDLETLQKAFQKAKKSLQYVYPGNFQLANQQNTFCPECGTVLINRKGHSGSSNIKEGVCYDCGRKIYGKF